jgi:hypothetical protein
MDFQAVIIPVGLALLLQVQGIEGIVRRPSGNHMPSPRHHSGPPTGVKAVVCVFSLTNLSQVKKGDGAGRYSSVQTRLIRQIDTDDSGRFRIGLPPGSYSIFTKKGNVFYATRRDEKNNIAPVEVLPGRITRVECSAESDQTAVY